MSNRKTFEIPVALAMCIYLRYNQGLYFCNNTMCGPDVPTPFDESGLPEDEQHVTTTTLHDFYNNILAYTQTGATEWWFCCDDILYVRVCQVDALAVELFLKLIPGNENRLQDAIEQVLKNFSSAEVGPGQDRIQAAINGLEGLQNIGTNNQKTAQVYALRLDFLTKIQGIINLNY